MKREVIQPRNEEHWLQERANDITSTEVAALFGFSPYITKFELWHRKKDKFEVEFKENERMKWGTRLQDSIAEGAAKDYGWKIRRMDEYIRIPKLRMGSSFDFSIEGQEEHKIDTKPGSVNKVYPAAYLNREENIFIIDVGLLEIKNVDSLQFKEKWIENEDGEIEAPNHIEIQVQHQMAVSDRNYAYICVLVGGNTLYVIRRDRNENVINMIFQKVAEFWKSIEDGIEPEPEIEKDYETIIKLNSLVDPGKIVDISSNEICTQLATQYSEASEKEKYYAGEKKQIKAQLMNLIGDSEKAIGNGYKISAGYIPEKFIDSFTRNGYRNFRLTMQK